MAGVLLTQTELQTIGAQIQAFAMTDTCTILRNPDQTPATQVPDGQGGYTGAPSSSSQGWTSVATYPCAVIESVATKGAEPFQQGQLQSKSTKIVLLPRLTDVRDSDRLKIAGVFYEVLQVVDPVTFEAVRRVEVQRQGQGKN